MTEKKIWYGDPRSSGILRSVDG